MADHDDQFSERPDLRNKCKRFRICIIGKSGVGKSTLLGEVFGFNRKKAGVRGRRDGRGIHNIWQPIMGGDLNESLIIHDSGGFEAGEINTVNEVLEFIQFRRDQPRLSEQLHCIWYCISIADDRPVQEADKAFFKYARDLEIPVIFVLTKFDRLVREYIHELGGHADNQDLRLAARAVREARRDVEASRSDLEDATGRGVCVQEVANTESSLVERLVRATTRIVDRNLIHVWIRAQGVLAGKKREECIMELPNFMRSVMLVASIPFHPFNGSILTETFTQMFWECLSIWNLPGQSRIFTPDYVDRDIRSASQGNWKVTEFFATFDWFTGPLTAPVYLRVALKMAVDLILIFQCFFWRLKRRRGDRRLTRDDLDSELQYYRQSELRATVHNIVESSIDLSNVYSMENVKTVLKQAVEYGNELIRKERDTAGVNLTDGRRGSGPRDQLPIPELE